jgi:2-keto-4-pentenoate hydratase/2-oxohepta-3-ene-1,7-dioic acid hydratase in catechol pathway
MGAMLRRLAIILLLLVAAFWGATLYVSRPLFSERLGDLPPLPAVADRSEALTLARSNQGLLLVISAAEGHVKAINLTARFGRDATQDTLQFFRATGYEALRTMDDPVVSVDLHELGLPLAIRDAHLAAGTNYAEHADEVLLDDPPFLFPKLAAATPWNTPIPWTRRLDYEAELAAIPLAPVTDPDDSPGYAVLLANDVTDRLTLVRELDLGKPMGTTGFAAGKGQAGFLPVGPWLVIPRKPDFFRDIEIRLYVDGRLRQRFNTRDMILSIDDIVRQGFRDRSMEYRRGSAPVKLMPAEGVPAGSLILTGTAGGVVFKPLNIWWQPAYLKAGDIVRLEASYLGVMEHTVVIRPYSAGGVGPSR